MKLRKVIKRIVALGTGASLVGATFLGAMAAADLKDYPSPFIKDGKFMGTIVIGDGGQTIDVIGATDIAVSLQYSATKKTATTTGTETTVEGDAFRISASGDETNLYEPLSSVKDVIDKAGLKALALGSITNDKGTYTYEQFIHPGNSSIEFVKDDQTGGTQDPKLYFKVKTDGSTKAIDDTSELFRFRVSFPTALKSDIDSSRDLDDLDSKKLTLLGKTYNIVNTDFTTAGKLTLELMGGAVEDTLEAGKSKTYSVSGKDYEVTLNAVTTTTPAKAQLTVNGQVTDSLEGGQTFTLSDGTQIGIKEVIPTKAAADTPDLVTFYLGAKKITIADSNSSSGNVAGTFSIGSNDISDGAADIVWTNTTSDLSISGLSIAWQSSDNYYIPAGGKLSDVVKADKDVVDLLGALGIDFQFTGLKSNVVDMIGVVPSGSNNVKLRVKTKSGQQISEDIWWFNSTRGAMLAKDAGKHVAVCERVSTDAVGDTSCGGTFHGGAGIGAVSNSSWGNADGSVALNNFVGDEDMFVVETNKDSHMLQLKKFDSANTKLTIKNMADSQTEDISVVSSVATFYKNGYQYSLTVDGAYTYANLTQIAGDSTDNPFNSTPDIRADLWSEHGAKIRLAGNATIIVEGQGISRSDTDTATHNITIGISVSNSKLTPSTVRTNSPTYNDITTDKDPTISLDSNSNKREAMTKWGTLIKQDTSGDQDTIDLEYPEKEAIANIYVTSGATSSSGGGSSTDSVTVQRIEVGAAKLASEVTDLKAQNTIIVGGPCVNKFADEVLANPADCAQGFEDGKGLIQIWQHTNGNVALLIAGYSGQDTRTAAQVVANYKEYAGKLTGGKVEVTTASKTVKTVST